MRQNQRVRSRRTGAGPPRAVVACALVLSLAALGCGLMTGNRSASQQGPVAAVDGASAAPTWAPINGQAPRNPYRVGSRTITFTNTPQRTLKTTIWYPRTTSGAVAGGRFPVVAFSHGLHGLPVDYVELATRWAAAGFVVLAPTFPHTSRGTKTFEVADVVNQPADVSFALTKVLALDTSPTDPLRGHLRTDR